MTVRGFNRFLMPLMASALFALPAMAQDAGGSKEIKTYEMPTGDEKPAVEGKKKKEPLGVKALAPRPEAMADEKLDQAIRALDELIEMTAEDDPSKPEFLARKAELYWDKAENYFNKAYGNTMFESLRAAQDSGDEARIATVQAEQQVYLDERERWQLETVKVYGNVVDDYPGYPGLDAVLYYLGFTLVQMDNGAEAFPYFSRIIREAPTSQFAPDALLNIGEFYFNSGRMDDAAMIYSEVENFPMSAAYGLAIYKKGWCLYNMGQFEAAMSQFLVVIDYTRSDAAKAVGYGNQLLREAQRDLVMVYSQVGSPENAIKVFKKITPDGYMDLAIRLAEGYASQGEYVKSIRLFKKIIIEYVNRDDAYRIVEFQRSILTNAYKLGIAARVVEEARRLIGLLDKFQKTAPPEFIKPEMASAEQMVRIIATTYHKEVAVTKEQRTQEFTHMLYAEYLRLFPDADERYAMTLNYAQLLVDLGKSAEAATQYNRVVEMRPDGEHALEAARLAVFNYYEMHNRQETAIKSEDSLDLERKELPEFEKKLVAACDRYLRMAKPDAADVVQARFLAAMVLYEYNHFDDAIAQFHRIIQDDPDHENASDAARLLLSSLHLKRDIKGLNAAADEIARNPKLMQGDVPGIVTRIREQADFNKCYEFEQHMKHRTAGECFLEYVRNFPATPLKDRSLINAANNFFKARLVERSLQANTQLFNDMPKSPLAPRALYNVGEIYRRLAVYSEAARFYEIFVKMLPKHELTEEALRYATVFRSGLGEYDAAIKNFNLYLRLFKDSEHTAGVSFEIGVAREKQGKHSKALKYFQSFIRKFGKEAGLDLYLKAHLKIAHMYKAMKNRKKTLAAYAETVKAWELLTEGEKSKLKSVGLSAVAEARFMQGEAVLSEVRAVKLKLPEKVLTKAIAKKLQLIKSAMDVFQGVEGFGQPHWTIAALSRKGFGFQDLAESIENAPIPRKLNDEQKAMFQEGLGQKALPIWEKAKTEFKRCVTMAQQLKWYNTFSEQAEEALMSLEPDFKTLPDIRPAPGYYSLNEGKPRLLPVKEGEDAPKWTDAGVKSRVKNAAQGSSVSGAAAYNMGAVLEVEGDLKGAKTWYNRALDTDRGLSDAVARLGVIALAEGDRALAQAEFDRALKIDPANSGAHNFLAAKAIGGRDFTEAVNHARMALVSDPDSMDAYLNLAAAYYEMGLLDVGLLVGRNALGLDKANAPIQNMLGLVFVKKGEVRNAVKLFEKAVNDDPELFDARMDLGAVTLAYKDFVTAGAQYEKAVELNPASTTARMGHAVALRGLDKGDEALRILTEIAGKDPGNADVHYNLCLLYQETLSDYGKALKECRQFISMAPAHAKTSQARTRVEGIEMIMEAMEDDAAAEKAAAEEEAASRKAAEEEAAEPAGEQPAGESAESPTEEGK